MLGAIVQSKHVLQQKTQEVKCIILCTNIFCFKTFQGHLSKVSYTYIHPFIRRLKVKRGKLSLCF